MTITSWPRAMANANTMLHLPRRASTGSGCRGIIALHGHNGSALGYAQGVGDWLTIPSALGDAGFAVLAVDMGATSWLNGASTDAANVSAMGAVKAAYNELKNVVGVTGTKMGLLGESMGGGSALIFIKQNPTLVACAYLVNPLTDLDWAHSTSGYTPAYSTGGVTPGGGWAAEIDTAYSSNYAANAPGHKIRDEYATWALGLPIKVSQASDDAALPPNAASAFVTGVNDTKVTLRSPAPTGGHLGSQVNIPAAEVIDFFQANLLGAA